MLDKIHQILRDPECSGNIWTLVIGFWLATSNIMLLVYGFCYLDHTWTTRDKYFEVSIAVDALKKQVDSDSIKLIFMERKQSQIMPSCIQGRPNGSATGSANRRGY